MARKAIETNWGSLSHFEFFTFFICTISKTLIEAGLNGLSLLWEISFFGMLETGCFFRVANEIFFKKKTKNIHREQKLHLNHSQTWKISKSLKHTQITSNHIQTGAMGTQSDLKLPRVRLNGLKITSKGNLHTSRHSPRPVPPGDLWDFWSKIEQNWAGLVRGTKTFLSIQNILSNFELLLSNFEQDWPGPTNTFFSIPSIFGQFWAKLSGLGPGLNLRCAFKWFHGVEVWLSVCRGPPEVTQICGWVRFELVLRGWGDSKSDLRFVHFWQAPSLHRVPRFRLDGFLVFPRARFC